MPKKLKILFASSEVHPYAKTGGLADIAGSLPKALKKMGHDVRVIMPKYKTVIECPLGFTPIGPDISVPIDGKIEKAFLFQGHLDENLPIYFVGKDSYYHRDHLYGTNHGDYADNSRRFIFFSRAVLEFCKATGFQPDIIHCNDWQTGLVPAYLKTVYAEGSWFQKTRTVFSIHNLGYQGNFPPSELHTAGLPVSIYNPEQVEFYNHFSFLKAGLVFADLLTTVSPTYSKEIQTKVFGFGMEGLLQKRSKDLFGILNGVDYLEWNPAVDPWIKQAFSHKNLKGKLACKNNLADLLSLKITGKTPVLCLVTRLSGQKGIDLVIGVSGQILDAGAALVILGSGESKYEDYFKILRQRFPAKVGAYIGFDEPLAHRILAGSDILLMPSQYEPCGLTQMYALKYGTVPIVRSVGGLQDTVSQFNPRTLKGTGFKFRPYEISHFFKAISKALAVYNNKSHWQRLMLNGMECNNSWDTVAQKYHHLYLRTLKK